MVGAQAFAVALADFGQDVDPVARLNTVVGLDVECPLRLNNLEHLEQGKREESKYLLEGFWSNGQSSRDFIGVAACGSYIFHLERLFL